MDAGTSSVSVTFEAVPTYTVSASLDELDECGGWDCGGNVSREPVNGPYYQGDDTEVTLTASLASTGHAVRAELDSFDGSAASLRLYERGDAAPSTMNGQQDGHRPPSRTVCDGDDRHRSARSGVRRTRATAGSSSHRRHSHLAAG